MKKLIRTADLRKALDSYNREEISYGRMVEMLNECANKALTIPVVVGQSEQLKAEGRKEATEEIRQWLIEMDYEGLAESL